MARFRRALGVTLVLASAVAGAVPAEADPVINLAHLDWLRRELVRPDGQHLAYWQMAARPQKAGARGGAYRDVDPGPDGVSCVDDVARVAVVYALEGDRTGDATALAHAREALQFVRAMAAGDGTYYNYLYADGRIDMTAPASRHGLTWWTARALWATAVGAHVFARRDPVFAADLRHDAARTVEKLLWDTVPRYHRYIQWGPQRIPGWFMGGEPDITATAMLGLATLEADAPSPVVKLLMKRYGEAIADYHAGDAATFPYHAHLPTRAVSTWRAADAHMLHALALAGRVLASPRLVDEARHEADHFTIHLLLNGGAVAAFTPAPRPFPQSVSAIEPQVSGLLALYDATGDARYGKLAGLFASWLAGDNAGLFPMYDAATGRVFDGIEAATGAPAAMAGGTVSEDAGLAATVEGLLTLEVLAAHPHFLPYLDARPLGAVPSRILEAEAAPAVARVMQAAGGTWSGDRYALMKPGEALRWTTAVPGDYMLIPVFEREHHLDGERATLRVSAGGQTQAYRPVYPQANAPAPTVEAGGFGHPFHLKAGDAIVAAYAATARQPLRLDGIVLQPAMQARTFRMGGVEIALVRNYGDHPRAFTWPTGSGATGPVYGLRPHESQLLERSSGSPRP